MTVNSPYYGARPLDSLHLEWADCQRCYINRYRQSPIVGSGKHDADIVFVFDRPDVNLMFGGALSIDHPQMFTLEELLDEFGVAIKDQWITTTTMCPTADPHEDRPFPLETMPAVKSECWTSCRPRLLQEVHLVQPELVVACGANALKALYSKGKPPGYDENLGRIVEVEIPGTISYPVPTLITYSMLQLYRTEEAFDPNNTWPSAREHIELALRLVMTMKEYRGNNG